MIQLPRLLDKQFQEVARLHPSRLSATDKLEPTSTATMGLPYGEPAVKLRDYVEIFDANGSKGIYRVEGINASDGERQTVNLSHGIVTLEDVLMPPAATTSGSIKTMLTAVLAQQAEPLWSLGDVEVPEDEVYTINTGNAIALQTLINIAALVPEYAFSYDQSTTPWVLHFRKREQEASCECRLARNMSNISVSFSPQEMCTRVTSELLPNGHMDADNVSEWGVISRELPVEDNTTQSGAVELAEKYLEQHKHPTASIEIEAVDLSVLTGESLDALTLGRLCRVALPDWGVTYNHQIVSVYWADLIGKPQQKKLSLATRKKRAETALAQAVQAKRQSQRNYGHIVETEKTVKIQAEQIALRATKNEVEDATTRISSVEIDLDAAKAAIDLKADRTEYNDLERRVTSAEVNIDGANAEIQTKASREIVDQLTGEVDELETTFTVGADGIRETIQKNDKTISEVKATIDGLEHWVTDADGNVAELTNTVRGMESKVETADGKVSILTNTADGLTNTVFGQGGELAQLKTRADEISAGVRDANGNIGSLSVKADNVTAKVKGVEGQVSQLAVTADGLEYTLTKQGQELSSLKALIDEISLTVKDTNGAMGQFVIQSDKIAGKLTDASGKLTALQELTENRFSVVIGDIQTVEDEIASVTGSALWQTRNAITGVVGNMTYDENGNVYIKEGGGLRIFKGGVAYGVYDENNLTAGLLVQKLNGSTTAKIKADRINLEGYVTIEAFEALQGEVDNLWSQQLIVDSLSANNVTAGVGDFDNLVFGTIAGKNSDAFIMDIVNTQLTTKTVKVVTDASFRATGEIAVRDADGNIVGTAITGGRVNYSTEEITYVVYAGSEE